LMANDREPFARWQAAADYAMRLALAQIPHGDDASPLADRIANFADALEQAITIADYEPAYRAELLRLPSETDLAREIGKSVDPGAIHVARKTLLKAVAKQIGPTLSELYESYEISEPYNPSADQMGRRALRNACLALTTQRNTKADRERLANHYWQSTNMTDQAHALALFAHGNSRARQDVLDDFFERWKDDHVVIDTWFAVQASAPQNSTLQRTRKLTTNDRYNGRTPNKVRAVVGTFAMNNPVQFNRPDGKGYAFAAEQILAIDAFNPQLAARLLGAFRSWRTLERDRRKLAKKSLTSIASAPSLSRDVLEIATRILGTEA
ncbi:MAG: aminopeptidase N C-terminal domain-containing protein, partial [Pseudomonadota bacterium]